MTGKYWDRPWSLIDGCTPCSSGCDHCWSMAMGKRFHRWPEKVTERWDRLDIPAKVKKPTVWAVWNDLFHKDVPDDFILQSFKVMGGAWHHKYLILTKRPENLKKIIRINPMLKAERRSPMGRIWDHVWLGVTVCNQQEADEKIPHLLQTPAAHRWVSIEPMLGPIELKFIGCPFCGNSEQLWVPNYTICRACGNEVKFPPNKIDAVVLGGETGPGARPMHPDWVRSVRDQCQDAGVPFFFKGWGEWHESIFYTERYKQIAIDDEGGILQKDEYTEEYIRSGHIQMSRKGRTKIDRLLDGREHNDLPWREGPVI